MASSLVYRIRVPVTRSRRLRRRLGGGGCSSGRRTRRRSYRRRRGLCGGFIPAVLAPIIAAAVGAVPAIASVALQAKALNQR
ncbi:pX [Murine adenovirus 2]|uniref:PX n=1 Tax=Murine adenovirus 2 TaxID=931972 RepID=E7CH40_9ADEN|nr:pX [Murine adenovirus 2]ADR77841.1 pX [Murine adenovirus 2]